VIFASHRIFSSNQIKEDELGGACSTYGENRNICTALLGKPERKRPLERTTSRWEDNIKMDVKLTGNLGLNWIRVFQESDQVAGWCVPRNEPVGFVKTGSL
jgi:hypothetical protein